MAKKTTDSDIYGKDMSDLSRYFDPSKFTPKKRRRVPKAEDCIRQEAGNTGRFLTTN